MGALENLNSDPLNPGMELPLEILSDEFCFHLLKVLLLHLIRIDGVEHEFSSIKGVVEDVTEIVLNLKKIRFRLKVEEEDSEKVTINISGKDVFKAGDLE
jgi:DNA-directed RNA polymerase subunit alpha